MTTLKAHRAEATLTEDGAITLRGLPFRRGESVEVIVLPFNAPPNGNRYPLRGTPVELINPTAPVGVDDWDTSR